MRLTRSALAIAALILAAAPTAGCKVSENAAGDVTVSPDTDTTDYSAPAADPPPAPEAENPGSPPSANEIWVGGSWRYEHGKYVWGRGHWERRRDGFTFHPARWVEVNGRWEHHPGHWNSEKPGVGHPPHTDDHHPAEHHPEPPHH